MISREAILAGVGTSQRDRENGEHSGKETIQLGVAPYFLVAKSPEEKLAILASYGMDAYDPVWMTPEIKEKLWNKTTVDEKGFLVFPPKTLILAHTSEHISVPADQYYSFRQYFVDAETEETLPLTTHVSAPRIQPLSEGPQTYEIINESAVPLTIQASRLICIADISWLTGAVSRTKNRSGNFGVQEAGKISLGNKEDWEFRVIRNALLAQGAKSPLAKV